MTVRPAAVAGLFYEAEPARLQQHVEELLARAAPGPDTRPRALVVPHAGYIYSGFTAATAYGLLAPYRKHIHRVALLGPAHRVYLQGMAIPSVATFATPLGQVPLDTAALVDLQALPGITLSDEAHRQEHSLEVQLPFLQRVLGDFSLLPIVVGQCPAGQVAAVIDHLAREPDTLLIISTDLSHFHAYSEAESLDRQTCERILARDTHLSGEDACGAHALNGLLASDFCAGLDVELLHRCNSGDTTGDHSRVVGYGAFALH